MHNLDPKVQYPGRESHLNLNYLSAFEPAISNQQPDKLSEPTRTEKTANLAEKKPCLLGTAILVIATITLYGLGIHQLSNTVTNILQTAVEEVDQDYRFRVF
ncbi:hypothetical protein [Pleurocapsa sp. PCC 7319]|uniref:hypothetical protein n=1 Tax=Pleurocapsa sp. PCC 7319 TaxID=118161 RepID=UPI0003496BBF|nr:hypothetical protein [Pleurocapsa sp. PCC 7319]